MANRNVGQLAEQQASSFLEKKGLRLLEQNFRCYVGEIDLIMRDKTEIVFVEVRKRSHSDFGDPIESVNLSKQRKIIKTATYYLQKHNWLDKVQCRFDIIGISNDEIEWIEDAFSTPTF